MRATPARQGSTKTCLASRHAPRACPGSTRMTPMGAPRARHVPRGALLEHLARPQTVRRALLARQTPAPECPRAPTACLGSIRTTPQGQPRARNVLRDASPGNRGSPAPVTRARRVRRRTTKEPRRARPVFRALPHMPTAPLSVNSAHPADIRPRRASRLAPPAASERTRTATHLPAVCPACPASTKTNQANLNASAATWA